MKRFYAYILKSRNGSYYVGSTNDRDVRLSYHNDGKVKSTKSGRPWKMIYSESFDTLGDARKRELQIKNWKSRAAIERLIKTALSSNG